MQDHDKTASSRSPDGALNQASKGGIFIAQLISGIDNTVLYFIVILIIILIPAVLLLKKFLQARAAGEGRARRQRLDYQPSAKPSWVAIPVPISRYQKQQPVSSTAPVPEVDLLENCRGLQESLVALARKYSLDSFTIATSDGLVFASSGGNTALEDAASYSGNHDIRESAGMAVFGLDHKGSLLTGIIRSQGIITGEIQKRIENDTKDILNRWI